MSHPFVLSLFFADPSKPSSSSSRFSASLRFDVDEILGREFRRKKNRKLCAALLSPNQLLSTARRRHCDAPVCHPDRSGSNSQVLPWCIFSQNYDRRIARISKNAAWRRKRRSRDTHRCASRPFCDGMTDRRLLTFFDTAVSNHISV